MTLIEFNSNLLVLILLLISCPLAFTSTSCSVFPSLNCSCFQSNVDLNSNSSIKTYSHLYCQGNSLTEKTFQAPFGADFKYQSRFRTVSIEFSNETEIEIQSNQFDSLATLFSETDVDAQIEIYLRFNGFRRITFKKNSLTSNLFQGKHPNKRLWVHLIPARSNLTQIELDNENTTNVENQFNFSTNCFSGLTVSQFSIYIHTIRDRFPALYTFEEIFNNTNIGELHFHGAIIRPGPSSLRSTFGGRIRSLTLHRHVDTIDSNTFPFYSQVYSFTIHSIEAHSMNLSSFLLSHTNLRGLEIIKPRFEVSIDQLIPTLDSLTLDIEHLNKKTLLIARHIHNLKLGSQLRTISPEIFHLLSRRLHHLDLSDIDLSQMASDSRCHLVQYLSKHSEDHLNIIYPRTKDPNECHCARLFLDHLRFKHHQTSNDATCSRMCHFSDCSTISDFFKEKYPLVLPDSQQSTHLFQEMAGDKTDLNAHLPAVEIFSDPVDIEMANFLMNQTSDQERDQTQRRTTTDGTETISTLENIQEYDDVLIPSTPQLSEPLEPQIDGRKSGPFSWLSFAIGVGVVLLSLLVIGLIVFFVIRYRKAHDFKPVPVYV